VAYSPLGRGFFSSGAKLVVTELPDDDFRRVRQPILFFHDPYIYLLVTK
jgi:hypothetical protein